MRLQIILAVIFSVSNVMIYLIDKSLQANKVYQGSLSVLYCMILPSLLEEGDRWRRGEK